MFALRYKGIFETDSLTSMGVDDSWMNSKDAAVWGNVVFSWFLIMHVAEWSSLQTIVMC